MLQFFSTYFYFTYSLVLLALFGPALYAFPSQRRLMLWGGVVALPTSLYQILFVPEYWEPVQVFRFLAGPEDLMFLFSTGGLSWLIVPAVYPKERLRSPVFGGRMVKRWVTLKAFFLAVWISIWLAGSQVMGAGLWAAAALLAVLLYLRRDFWKLAAYGSVAFGAAYTVFASAAFALHPGFARQWNPEALSGLLLIGVPIEEIAWGLAFGAVWPLFLVYLFDIELESASRPVDGTRQTAVAR